MKNKHCRKCKRLEPEVVLHVNSKRLKKDGTMGYSYSCRECESERCRAYRKTEKGKEVWRNLIRRQYANHRLETRARQNLNYHIRKGHITRPNVCENCLTEKKTEGHHEDYTKPLDVRWLCRPCHRLVDQKEG